MEVASITGHKDIRMLRTYTHLQTNNLVKNTSANLKMAVSFYEQIIDRIS